MSKIKNIKSQYVTVSFCHSLNTNYFVCIWAYWLLYTIIVNLWPQILCEFGIFCRDETVNFPISGHENFTALCTISVNEQRVDESSSLQFWCHQASQTLRKLHGLPLPAVTKFTEMYKVIDVVKLLLLLLQLFHKPCPGLSCRWVVPEW